MTTSNQNKPRPEQKQESYPSFLSVLFTTSSVGNGVFAEPKNYDSYRHRSIVTPLGGLKGFSRPADIEFQLPDIETPTLPRSADYLSVEPGGAVITVPADFNQLVEKIAQETGLEKGEVLRRALGLMDVAVEARKQGNTIGILDQDGNLESEIVGLGI